MESGSGASHEHPSTSKQQSEDGGGEPDRKRRQPEVGAESVATERVTTELHRVAMRGDARRVKELLEKGSSTRALDEYDRTPLHLALDYAREDSAQLLVEADAEIDEIDQHGRSPLHHAAKHGYHAIITKLLAAGADTRRKDEDGRTPLHMAICWGKKRAALLLAEADAENEVLDEDGRSPLHHAASQVCTLVAEKLLWSGVRPHEKDGSGDYPLQRALRSNSQKIANMIIAACALRGVPIDWEELKLPPRHLDPCLQRLSECEAELGKMRDVRVGESTVSLFDVTTRHPTRLVPRFPVRSALLLYRLKAEYPIYGDLLVARLRRIKKRNVLARRSLELFSRMLPLPCAEVILLYLSEEDMQNFIRAMEFKA